MKNLPISANKEFKYSITYTSWDEESKELGETNERGYEVQDDIDTIGEILHLARNKYYIYQPVSFQMWESTEPHNVYSYYQGKGVEAYYTLHITNVDGTEITQEENDFITFLLSDGQYELNKFRDYAIGGVVIGAVAIGIGGLIAYYYFKGNKDNKSAKSVTHIIDGKERTFPIKDAWKKEHTKENKSEEYEVPQEDRYADGGLLSGISKEDYFLVVQNWVYFTFNYPSTFLSDLTPFHREKFSAIYEKNGADAVLPAFWKSINDEAQYNIAIWVKNNYVNSKSEKEKIQSISDKDYYDIVAHWNMFSQNPPMNFIEDVFGDMADHFESKWVRYYSRSAIGSINRFFVELSSDYQEKLTNWVHDKYTSTTFAGGGSLDLSPTEKAEMFDYLDNSNWSIKSFMDKFNKTEDESWDIIDAWALSRGIRHHKRGGETINKMAMKKDKKYWEKRENLENFLSWTNDKIYWMWLNEELSDTEAISMIKEIDGVEYNPNKKYAKGGMTEHGLRVGDKILSDGKDYGFSNEIEVSDSNNKRHIVNLDKGNRGSSFKTGGGIMADGRIVLRDFNGVGGNKNKTYKLIKDDRDSDGKPYYTLIEYPSNKIMAQGDSFEEVNGYANLMSGKFADGGETNERGEDLIIGINNLKKAVDGINSMTKYHLEFESNNKYLKILGVNNEGILTDKGLIEWRSIDDRHSNKDGLMISLFDLNWYGYFKLTDEERENHPYNFMAEYKADLQDRFRDREEEGYFNDGGEADDNYGGQRNKIVTELKGMKGGLDNKAPYVFLKDGFIYVSAENGDNYADYDEYTIDEKLEDLADRYNTYWDWETEGSIVLAPIDRYADGGEAVNEWKGEFLTITANKEEMVIKLTDEGIEEVNEMREDGKSDADIMYELFEDITANSELMYHSDLGESGFGLTSASGVTDGYYYDDDGYLIQADETANLYYFNDYMLRSEIDDLLEGELILIGADVEFADGGEAGMIRAEGTYKDGSRYVSYHKTLEEAMDRVAEYSEDELDLDYIRYYDEEGNSLFARGGKAGKKYYWITMDRDYIDEYIRDASRMYGMFEGEIYTQAPNKVAFDTQDDMFTFTSMIDNHNDDNDLQEGDEGYIHYEELYNGEPRENIWDKIISNKYAVGGEVEDWMEEALESLIEETGNDDLEITYVPNVKVKYEFIASDGDAEYRVFETEGDAEITAIEQVREDLENYPENFNQDWLMNFIDGRDFFEEQLNEMNDSYIQDIESESDRKYANRLIAELVENGLMDDEDAESDNAEELAEDLKYDYMLLLTEQQLDEGNNGLDYFINNFGEEETYKMVIDNNLIDIDEASKDAVNVDGIAHFLSSYDGETLYLANDCVAYRTN